MTAAHVAVLTVLAAAFACLVCFGSGARADIVYQYDSDGRVTGVYNSTTGQGVGYTYDSDGNITQVFPTATPTPTP